MAARRLIPVLAVTLTALLAATAIAFAQDYDPTQPGGYDPGNGDDGEYGGGPGDDDRLKLTLTAKRKQGSLKAVKAKATCEGRACTIRARGRLKAGDRKAKLKPDEESLSEGDTDKLKLKLPKRAKRTARAAAREDEKLKAKVTAKAKGVGGGGSDKDSVKIKLKP
jgi:hypothetical protein